MHSPTSDSSPAAPTPRPPRALVHPVVLVRSPTASAAAPSRPEAPSGFDALLLLLRLVAQLTAYTTILQRVALEVPLANALVLVTSGAVRGGWMGVDRPFVAFFVAVTQWELDHVGIVQLNGAAACARLAHRPPPVVQSASLDPLYEAVRGFGTRWVQFVELGVSVARPALGNVLHAGLARGGARDGTVWLYVVPDAVWGRALVIDARGWRAYLPAEDLRAEDATTYLLEPVPVDVEDAETSLRVRRAEQLRAEQARVDAYCDARSEPEHPWLLARLLGVTGCVDADELVRRSSPAPMEACG